MTKRLYFKHMPQSEVLEKYANDQLAKIEDFLSKEKPPYSIDLTFEPSHTKEHHRVELIVKSAQYDKVVNYEHKGTDFYDVVDRVIDTMYRELHEAKRRLVDDRKMVGRHEEFKKQR